ncbi:MAG: phosphotransferase [Patescibacteria group bacterium]
MENQEEQLKLKIQELLGEEIADFSLKGKGYCNDVYYARTRKSAKYSIKKERTDAGASKQENDLSVEAALLRLLQNLDLSIPTPRVIFVSENPKMFAYEYIEGEMLLGLWSLFSEEEKINTCRALGFFHAELGKKVTKEMLEPMNIQINMSSDLHPEVSADFGRLILDPDVPEEFKILAKEAKVIFDRTQDKQFFQFLHNDSHHENILIKEKKISGIIDFGAAEFGEVAKEFSRYIRDFPDYFQYIVSAYEEKSGNKLSYERLVSFAFLNDFVDVIANHRKGAVDRIKAESSLATYQRLLHRGVVN